MGGDLKGTRDAKADDVLQFINDLTHTKRRVRGATLMAEAKRHGFVPAAVIHLRAGPARDPWARTFLEANRY